MIHYRTIDSPIGPLALAGRGRVLTNLRMLNQTHEPNRKDWVPDDRAFPDVVEQLEAYFARERTDFDLELGFAGSEFQRRVWQALLTIRLFDFDRAISMMSGLRPAVCGCSGIVSGGLSSRGFGIHMRRV